MTAEAIRLCRVHRIAPRSVGVPLASLAEYQGVARSHLKARQSARKASRRNPLKCAVERMHAQSVDLVVDADSIKDEDDSSSAASSSS